MGWTWTVSSASQTPMTPSGWLNIALHGLAPQVTARVRAEYLAHLEDAQDAGESEAAVLREWGDPHTANRELRKAHLTVREADLLPAGYAPTLKGLSKALLEDAAVLCCAFYSAVQGARQGDASALPAAWLLSVLVALPLLRWRMLSRQAFSAEWRVGLCWLLSPLLLGLVIFFALLGWGVWRGETGSWKMALVALLCSLYHLSRLLRALGAARKAGNQG